MPFSVTGIKVRDYLWTKTGDKYFNQWPLPLMEAADHCEPMRIWRLLSQFSDRNNPNFNCRF